MTSKKCEYCNKTSTVENADYCPFCGRPYIYCSINMCSCNENIVDTEKCKKCHGTPAQFTKVKYDKYVAELDSEYENAKKIKIRLDTIWRKVNSK
jgi:hypothetical protein